MQVAICDSGIYRFLFQPSNQGFGSAQKFAFGRPNAMLAKLTGLKKKAFIGFTCAITARLPVYIRVDSNRNPGGTPQWSGWIPIGILAGASGIIRVIPPSPRPSKVVSHG